MDTINEPSPPNVLSTGTMLHAVVMADTRMTEVETFDGIFRQRQSQVLRIAYRITGNWADAEDVAQEAFVRLHKHATTFPNSSALGSWLYRVTVNLCLDRARVARPSEELLELPSTSATAEQDLIRRQQRERLGRALLQLPPRERAAITLREIEGLSTAEVAEILGSAEATIRSQVANAMARLRKILEQEQRS